MNPDPNRHEASRNAMLSKWDEYCELPISLHNPGPFRYAWDSALDWQAAQVCGWTHDATNEEYDTDCARSFRCVVYGWDCVPGFCPGCGRRVKIQTETPTTTDTNK